MTNEDYIGIRSALAEIIKGTIWEDHVFLVGGCVRDEMMHRSIHDIDIAIDTPNGGIRFARWLEKKNLTARGRSIQIFMHFGTAKVKLRRYPQEIIDCVQTRKDRYVYEKVPKPIENFGTIYEDAIRRDLTINSLFVNISTGELLDPTGMALHDIENHVIRTPNDPDVTLTDNPMHVLRCIRFAVRYGWDIDAELLECLKRNVNILAESTAKRILKEVTAITQLENKDRALQLIEEIGAMPYVAPVIELINNMPEATSEEEKPKYKHKHHHRGGRHRRRKRPAGTPE